ncbi:MAG: aminodeoxychorismate synthase, component I [Planctomycetaceae bacterium]|nr:aminodeoxychorismate synthase, component I [Planctomycetaceae bacterium]
MAKFADCSGLLVFESVLKRQPLGRYSFLVAGPYQSFQLQEANFGHDPFEEIQREMAACQRGHVAELPPFQGGAAGLLSYELGGCFEKLPRTRHDEFELPALSVGLYDWVITWDHAQKRCWVISQGFPETNTAAREVRARERLGEVLARLDQSVANFAQPGTDVDGEPLAVNQLAPTSPAGSIANLASDFSRDDYLKAVESVIEYIRAGDIFQANLSQRLLFPSLDSTLELYSRLRDRNPAPFAGYYQNDDWAVVSASPERFLKVEDREVETRPIKGTRQRQTLPEADLFTRDALRESGKDTAENVMIVDLLRNDLSRVCQPGSIRVPQLCAVETYETVQHLVSEIRGTLADDHSVWDLIKAAFPGGSITGAPKVRAMEIIAELEPTARGPYCGSLFYVGFDEWMDSSILIRTFTSRRDWIQCPVGGGIVADSDPGDEFEETMHKAEGMLRALGR